MKNAQSLSDPATHYRVKLRGRVDVEWLQSFDSSAEISFYRLSISCSPWRENPPSAMKIVQR
jgi:hypothetical protein